MILKLAQKVGISWPDLAGRRVVAVATIAVTSALLGIRHLGGLQSLELVAYDYLVRLRSQETKPDPRILVVTITEEDIKQQKTMAYTR
jgi:CHASE2 domain-containing sensor protein